MSTNVQTVPQTGTQNQASVLPKFSVPPQTFYQFDPRFSALLGSDEANILFSAIRFRWQYAKDRGRKSIYKFDSPPKSEHPAYRHGDSWTEELNWSDYKLRKAKDAFRAGKVSNEAQAIELMDSPELDHIMIYWTDGNRLTHYIFNETAYYAALEQFAPPPIPEPLPEPAPQPEQNEAPIPVELPRPNREYRGETPDLTANIAVIYNKENYSIENKKEDAPDPACSPADDPPPYFDFIDSIKSVWNPERITQQHTVQARSWAADPMVQLDMFRAALIECRDYGKVGAWPYLAQLLRRWKRDGIPVSLAPAPVVQHGPTVYKRIATPDASSLFGGA